MRRRRGGKGGGGGGGGGLRACVLSDGTAVAFARRLTK
jgi:hypothetical protein